MSSTTLVANFYCCNRWEILKVIIFLPSSDSNRKKDFDSFCFSVLLKTWSKQILVYSRDHMPILFILVSMYFYRRVVHRFNLIVLLVISDRNIMKDRYWLTSTPSKLSFIISQKFWTSNEQIIHVDMLSLILYQVHKSLEIERKKCSAWASYKKIVYW